MPCRGLRDDWGSLGATSNHSHDPILARQSHRRSETAMFAVAIHHPLPHPLRVLHAQTSAHHLSLRLVSSTPCSTSPCEDLRSCLFGVPVLQATCILYHFHLYDAGDCSCEFSCGSGYSTAQDLPLVTFAEVGDLHHLHRAISECQNVPEPGALQRELPTCRYSLPLQSL